jgi:hypothetical protein
MSQEKRRTKMRNAIIVLAVLALTVPVWGASWDGGDTTDPHDWMKGDNWNPNGVPGSGVSISIGNHEARIYAGDSVALDTDTCGIAGTLKLYGDLSITCRINFFADSTPDDPAELIQYSGNLTSTSGTNHFRIGGWNSSRPQYGKYRIEGGSLYMTQRCLYFGDPSGGKGIFEIKGSAPSIQVDDYYQNANSELVLEFDGDADPIEAIYATDDVTLGGTLTITGTTTNTGPITIIDYDGTLTGTFDNVPTGWDVDYGSGSNSQVTVTIPEPATMVLLGLGGIGVLIRKRRK